MMQYFNFSRLINKYKKNFTLIISDNNDWDDTGKWTENNRKEVILEGAIISFKESKIFRSEGTLTTNDKRLFTLAPIDDALNGSNVIYEDRKYTIETCTDNAAFTGVYTYTLRYVSAFEEAQK